MVVAVVGVMVVVVTVLFVVVAVVAVALVVVVALEVVANNVVVVLLPVMVPSVDAVLDIVVVAVVVVETEAEVTGVVVAAVTVTSVTHVFKLNLHLHGPPASALSLHAFPPRSSHTTLPEPGEVVVVSSAAVAVVVVVVAARVVVVAVTVVSPSSSSSGAVEMHVFKLNLHLHGPPASAMSLHAFPPRSSHTTLPESGDVAVVASSAMVVVVAVSVVTSVVVVVVATAGVAVTLVAAVPAVEPGNEVVGHLLQLDWSQIKSSAESWKTSARNPESTRIPLASSSPYLSPCCMQLPEITWLPDAPVPLTFAKMVMVSRKSVRRSTTPGAASRSSNKISASASSTPARIVTFERASGLLSPCPKTINSKWVIVEFGCLQTSQSVLYGIELVAESHPDTTVTSGVDAGRGVDCASEAAKTMSYTLSSCEGMVGSHKAPSATQKHLPSLPKKRLPQKLSAATAWAQANNDTSPPAINLIWVAGSGTEQITPCLTNSKLIPPSRLFGFCVCLKLLRSRAEVARKRKEKDTKGRMVGETAEHMVLACACRRVLA
jgi:hypothetical protein